MYQVSAKIVNWNDIKGAKQLHFRTVSGRIFLYQDSDLRYTRPNLNAKKVPYLFVESFYDSCQMVFVTVDLFRELLFAAEKSA